MSGAAVAAMLAAAGAAAVICAAAGNFDAAAAFRRVYELRLHITAICLLSYFHQNNAVKWNVLHLIGMHKRATKFYNRCGAVRWNIEWDTLYAIYCAEHLIKADNDKFTAEYIRCAHAGYSCLDLLFEGIPEDQRPEPAIEDQAVWILRNYGK